MNQNELELLLVARLVECDNALRFSSGDLYDAGYDRRIRDEMKFLREILEKVKGKKDDNQESS